MEQTATLILDPLNNTFEKKKLIVPFSPNHLILGRQTNDPTTTAAPNNRFFASKVLSKDHAKVWAENEKGNVKIWIRDNKSSNGTYVNGRRLSAENRESEPCELRRHDTLELGVDVVGESSTHYKIEARVEFAGLSSSSSGDATDDNDDDDDDDDDVLA